MTNFILHPRLAADGIFVTDWPLSRVLLMNDRRFAWLVLVPRQPDLTELFDLDAQERAELIEETAKAGHRLKEWSKAAKINIGALGNVVPQLHVHVIARRPGDAAWPGPVWGAGKAVPYEMVEQARVVAELKRIL